MIQSTKEGKLFITTSDFFKQKEIIRTINGMLKSKLIKDIEKRKLWKCEK